MNALFIVLMVINQNDRPLILKDDGLSRIVQERVIECLLFLGKFALILLLFGSIFFFLIGLVRSILSQGESSKREEKAPKEFDPYAFLIGNYITVDGYDNETILSFTDLDFEQKRGYIWYYFPTKDRTSEETLRKISKDQHARKTISGAFKKLLNYWDFYQIKFAKESPFHPQYIIMTHVGKSLKDLGMEEELAELKELLRFFMEQQIPPGIKKEWKEKFGL